MASHREPPPPAGLRGRGRFSPLRRLFSSEMGAADHLVPRWFVLRALGLIYFSAFYSLVFQIAGLIGPTGILPAGAYLHAVQQSFRPVGRLWFAPTLLWLGSGPHLLPALCWVGMAASLLVVLNIWPRLALFVCFLCFLSFVSAAQDFSSYQSDGMLLEAGFIALFFAPPGIRPGLGVSHPPSRASLFLLQWEWFRIYFESGLVKLLSGDQQWRHLTAMDEYYQNGPLPTWIGWYVQHLPHWFHWWTALATLVLELFVVWALFMPRPLRLLCWALVTPWEMGVIVTANYTFLNYLVLILGFLLLDDRFLLEWMPRRGREWLAPRLQPLALQEERAGWLAEKAPPGGSSKGLSADDAGEVPTDRAIDQPGDRLIKRSRGVILRRTRETLGLAASCLFLTWVFYVTTIELIHIPFHDFPLPSQPETALEPFRIANQYGLFAVMTRGRYEIEFQGSQDGQNWTAYPFRYKPQSLNEAPGIYAPYQPRFDWNLWFASLGSWRQNSIVPQTEVRLLDNDPQVLALFRGNPFAKTPPRFVRAMLWQYWFTSSAGKRLTGDWWQRRLLGVYAPVLERRPDGEVGIVSMPAELPEHD